MGSGNRANQKTRRQKEVFYQPSLRETSQKLWRWPRHPAKTRFDPIRSMAKIHQTPTTTICPPSSIEGSSINQPVQPNLGQTNRYPIVQIGRQVRSRKESREERTTRRPS